jgi:hypothetical protein
MTPTPHIAIIGAAGTVQERCFRPDALTRSAGPAPADSAAQRRAEARVDQPDHRRRERPACMPGLAATPASLPTSPKLGVERLQSLSIEPAHRHCAQHRPHMPVQPAHHAVARRRLQLHNLKPPVEQLVHRRLRARVATLIDLVQQPRPHPLGVPGRSRSGGNRLDQVMLLLRHRIDAGVHPHSKRSTGQSLDLTTGPAATSRRAHQRQPLSGFAPRRQSLASLMKYFP